MKYDMPINQYIVPNWYTSAGVPKSVMADIKLENVFF